MPSNTSGIINPVIEIMISRTVMVLKMNNDVQIIAIKMADGKYMIDASDTINPAKNISWYGSGLLYKPINVLIAKMINIFARSTG